LHILIILAYIDDLQTITPSQLGCSNSFACPANLLGFGISFSTYPHVDVDDNGLEDLAVGMCIKHTFLSTL